MPATLQPLIWLVLTLRIERPTDFESVREVLVGAFARTDEADLVDCLRDDALRIASLVAVDGDRVVGHAMFSRVWIEDGDATTAVASLAPIAVRPDCQRRGIGSALIVHGIEVCRDGGWPAIVVVGHTAYYPRFGFSAATVEHLDTPYRGEHFMGLELHPGALGRLRGRVRYPECFA
jgi:putative acetyltransferase